MNHYAPLSDKEEKIATAIVNAAYKVHRNLGPGLLEKIYEVCFVYELEKMGYKCKRQIPIPIFYDDMMFEEGFRLDVLVENLVICELKAVVQMPPVFKAQIISHLNLMNKRLGFLINFNVPLIRNSKRLFQTPKSRKHKE